MELINTEKAIKVGMNLFLVKFKEALDRENINASGKLDESSVDRVITAPDFISGSVLALNYWVYQVFGRGKTERGGTGEVKKKIRQWIDNKGINPDKITKDELAFLITRKIHKEGFKGRLDLQKIVDEVQPEIDKLIEEAFKKDLILAMP